MDNTKKEYQSINTEVIETQVFAVITEETVQDVLKDILCRPMIYSAKFVLDVGYDNKEIHKTYYAAQPNDFKRIFAELVADVGVYCKDAVGVGMQVKLKYRV